MKNLKTFINENKIKIAFIIILITAIFTRLYKLNDVPYGINVDEAGMAYDAYCLANYGTDRYLNNLPLYLINFGGGQSALYAYLSSILIKIFGFSIYAIRLPAVIFGIVAIVLSYFMVKKELNEKVALMFMALITICPWHIMSSRWGLDCNLLAPMSIISMFFLLRAKNKLGYIAAGISIGLTLYTYALSYIIIPIFLTMTLIYMLYTKRITLKNVVIMGIPIFILALPLMLMLLINNGYLNEIKGIITIPKLWVYRGTEIQLSRIKENLGFFKTIFTNDNLVYNALPEYGTIYNFAVFLAIFGFFVEVNNLFYNIKNKKFEINSIMLFLFLSVMTCMLIIEEPNINKSNAAFIPLLFFTCTALRYVYKNYRIFFELIIILYALNFMSFQNFYFNQYEIKYEYQSFFEKDLIDALNYVEDNFKEKDIRIYTKSAQPYIYTLINNRISPYEFNNTLHENHRHEFSYGKYYFYDENIDENSVYIVKDNDNLVNNLLINNFEVENIKSYLIAYKK